MGKSVAAPPPVDYKGAAAAQGAANVDAARATAKLSNPNIIGPLGSQTVTYGQFNQAGYDKAMQDWQNSGGGQPQYDEFGNVTSGGAPMPDRSQFTTDADIPTVTQTLNPNAQKTLDAQQQVDLALANLGVQGIGTAQKVLGTPFQYQGPGIQTSLGNAGNIDTNPNLAQYGQAGANVQAGQIANAPNVTGMGSAQGFNPATMGMAGGFNPAQYGQAGGANLFGFGQARGLGGGQMPMGNEQIGNAMSALGRTNFGGPSTGFDAQDERAPGASMTGIRAAGPGYSEQRLMQATPSGVQGVDYGPRPGAYGYAQGGVQAPDLQQAIDTTGVGRVAQGPSAGQYGMAAQQVQGPNLQNRLDTSGLAAMPVNAGMTAQNAIMSRLDPQLQRQRSQLETQLANQGLVRGGEAFNAAITEQQQQENDLRTQAALQGINLDMAARQQGLGEQQALGNFGNQAQLAQFGAGLQNAGLYNAGLGQNFSQGLAAQQAQNAAQQQQFNQAAQRGEFGNQAQLQAFNAGLQNQAAQNAAVGQNFNQGMAASQQGNAAAQQYFNQLMGAQGLQNQAIQQNQQAAIAQQQLANQAIGQNQQAGLAAAQLGNAAINQNQQAGFQAAQLGNQALSQNQQAALAQQAAQNAAQAQGFGQNMGIQGLYNQAVQQNQQAALQQQTAQNAAQNQAFNQLLQSGQFGNTAAQQALQQQLSLYNQPLNQIAALMSGSQVQMPQFQGYTGATVQAAPVFQATQAGAQDAMARYNAAQQGANSLTSGLFGLGGAVLGGAGAAGGFGTLFSDRRLKSNIERIGTHPRGFGVYEYEIFGKRERGVMAQEVQQIQPEAVIQHPSGFLMVNYAAL